MALVLQRNFASCRLQIGFQMDISSNGSDACLGATGDMEESPRRQIGVARRPYADPPLRSGAKLDGLAKWL